MDPARITEAVNNATTDIVAMTTYEYLELEDELAAEPILT